MRLVKRGNDSFMLLIRGGNDMHVCLEPRTHDALRVPVSGAPIHGEILRADLQNLAIVFEAHARAEFDGVSQIIGLDFTPASELVQASAIHARYRSADPDDSGIRGRLSA